MAQTLLAPPSSPPSHVNWLVSNGQMIVGPVSTELLLRGITTMRVPMDALVKQPEWGAWRPVNQIREIARLEIPPPFRDHEGDLELANDFGELMLLALGEMIDATRAHRGLVFRDREPFVGFVASAAQGLDVDLILGLVLRGNDPVMEGARRGRVVVGTPEAAHSHRMIAERLGGPAGLRGVMMIPVRWHGRLLATVELGRVDHEFRGTDVGVAEGIARGVGQRVQKMFESRLQ